MVMIVPFRTKNFNPLRPRGRRLFFIGYFTTSITFQPTPPTRTETKPTFWKGDIPKISTHSAHEDGDRRLTLSVLVLVKFQPTPLWHGTCMTGEKKFQPTPPTRTETLALLRLRRLSQISTHSAHEDGDLTAQTISLWTATFQPTPPTRTETLPRIQGSRHQPISTHSAHEDGDKCY